VLTMYAAQSGMKTQSRGRNMWAATLFLRNYIMSSTNVEAFLTPGQVGLLAFSIA